MADNFPIDSPAGQVAISARELADGSKSEIVHTRPDVAALPDAAYAAGTNGTPNLSGLRVTSIVCLAGSSNATLKINGGPDITIPAGAGYEHPIAGKLVSPTIVFTNTASYVVCGVQA